MRRIRVGRKTVSLAVLMLYPLVFAAASWDPSMVPPSPVAAQKGPVGKWNPRKVPAGTEFAGDQVCAECHKNKVVTHAQSGMAMAMESIADSRVLAENPAMKFQLGPYTYEIKRQGKQSVYTVTDGRETISLPILYALGQGKAGQTYVLEYEGGLVESHVSYYREVRGLDFTIGAPQGVPRSLKQALGRRLSSNEALNCFGCHSTGAISGGQLRLDKMTLGIRCEACHGPGGEHAKAARAGEPAARLIFNPKRLSGDELTQDFCASCHQGSDEFSMSQSHELNSVRFQPYRIFQSKCYSDDRRISCTACHDPHEPLKQDAAYYDAKCLACHEPKEKPAGWKAPPGVESLKPGCRVGTRDCASCHMPRLGPPSAHFKFTDHYIRVAKPSGANAK